MINPYLGAKQPDEKWERSFLASLLSVLAEGLGPGRTADFRGQLGSFMEKSLIDYRGNQVGAHSVAPVLLLLQHVLFIMDTALDAPLLRHTLIVMCMATEKALSAPGNHLADRACQSAMLETLYKPLAPAWRQTIEFCFNAYKAPLETLINNSSSLGAWAGSIRDILPYLWLPKVAPIYETEYKDNSIIDDPKSYGTVPATYSNVSRTPMPFYSRLFTAEELRAHADEEKMIEEVFAHLHATLGSIAVFGEEYFSQQKAALFAIAKKDGRLAARQRVLQLKFHSLSIPTFFADELLADLS